MELGHDAYWEQMSDFFPGYHLNYQPTLDELCYDDICLTLVNWSYNWYDPIIFSDPYDCQQDASCNIKSNRTVVIPFKLYSPQSFHVNIKFFPQSQQRNATLHYGYGIAIYGQGKYYMWFKPLTAIVRVIATIKNGSNDITKFDCTLHIPTYTPNGYLNGVYGVGKYQIGPVLSK